MKTTPVARPTLWHQLYFVLASLIGLICVVIGLSVFVNTLLSSTLFKVKEQTMSMPPQPAIDMAALQANTALDAKQQEALRQWQTDYELWTSEQKNYSWEDESRKRSFAWSLALLLTGIPVFAVHAPVVFGWGKKQD